MRLDQHRESAPAALVVGLLERVESARVLLERVLERLLRDLQLGLAGVAPAGNVGSCAR
jgi:hypothetical protein